MKKTFVLICMILFTVSGLNARIITGKITDSANNPLPGASIMIMGTSRCIVSDMQGDFTLEVQEGKVVLAVSHAGYVTREVRVDKLKYIIIALNEDIAQLDEALAAGYGIQKSEDAVGPVSCKSRISVPGFYYSGSPAYHPVPDFNTEGYSSIHENGYKSPLREPLSTFSIDVDAASYSNVRRFISDGQKPVPDAVRIEEMINYFYYDYTQPHTGHPFSIIY